MSNASSWLKSLVELLELAGRGAGTTPLGGRH